MYRIAILLGIFFLFPLSFLKALPSSLPIHLCSSSNSQEERLKEKKDQEEKQAQQDSTKEEPQDKIEVYTTEDGTHITDIQTNQGRTTYKKIESPEGEIIVSHSARSRKSDPPPPQTSPGYTSRPPHGRPTPEPPPEDSEEEHPIALPQPLFPMPDPLPLQP